MPKWVSRRALHQRAKVGPIVKDRDPTEGPDPYSGGNSMASKTKRDLIISKSRTKAAVKKCNVSSDFYPALDDSVRALIASAERRAIANKRKTLKPSDL